MSLFVITVDYRHVTFLLIIVTLTPEHVRRKCSRKLLHFLQQLITYYSLCKFAWIFSNNVSKAGCPL